MEPFAGYAFNKAHAVCYAMVAYQTAYLKANYPVEYMAALMACFVDKSDKLATCMEECKRMGIAVLAPDINTSAADFALEGQGAGAEGSGPQHQAPLEIETRESKNENTPLPSKAGRLGLAALQHCARALTNRRSSSSVV